MASCDKLLRQRADLFPRLNSSKRVNQAYIRVQLALQKQGCPLGGRVPLSTQTPTFEVPPAVNQRTVAETSPEPMGFNLATTATSILTGRSGTTAPTTTESSPGLWSTVGTILGGTVGMSSTGQVLGTIGDALMSNKRGRATKNRNSLAQGEYLPLEKPYPSFSLGNGSSGGRRRPATAKVRRLVRLIGVSNAANMLNLSFEETAMIAVRPYRRRGISAASLRTTRRTLRAVARIQCALKQFTSKKCCS